MLKFLIIVILLCCPPYGWVALFLWFCFAEASKKTKEPKNDVAASSASDRSIKTSSESAAPAPMAVKVDRDTCYIYSVSTGSYIRTVGSDIVQASVSGDYVAATDKRGYVHIYKASTGAYIRQLGRNVVNAQIQGDEVVLTDQYGRVDVYSVSSGSYIRSL